MLIKFIKLLAILNIMPEMPQIVAENYSDIHYDSRLVSTNSIFVCIKGEKSDGHDYISDAIKKGASLIVVEKNSLSKIQTLINSQPKLFQIVDDSRGALAKLSSELYGKPSQKLTIIGVTGTNGKTTTTHLIQSLLDHCALLGTIGLKLSPNAAYKEMNNTTPQSKEIHQILKDLVDANFEYLTMEVSSHALQQKRVAEIKYKSIIVTNLTQDHLDYHITMENYFKAKALVFKQVSDYAILNVDDEYYERFKAEALKANLKIISYGVNNEADFRAHNINFTNSGLSFELQYQNQKLDFELKLNGLFNVYNALAAIAAVTLEGKSLEYIRNRFKNTEPVKGRFEVVKTETSPFCIIDYAHSPDGLMNVLKGARELIKDRINSKLVCVFGCGGDRDMTKRPKMGRIAYDLADFIYVTSDNPRSEDPEQIIADILTGIPDLKKAKVITDRRQAIQEAIANAHHEDIVVIAGKGHEDYQILKDKTIHFDDREETLCAIELAGKS